jgi:hypothetical protein
MNKWLLNQFNYINEMWNGGSHFEPTFNKWWDKQDSFMYGHLYSVRYDVILLFGYIANITRNKESTLPIKTLVKSLYSVINVLF